MENTFTIAWWITNKVGNDRYFLILDYDNFSAEKFPEIKEELVKIINKFSLSDAEVYKTKSWFHVYFFYDNKLNSKQIIEVLSHTEKTDKNFRDMFPKFFAENKGVPLRAYGKYDENDIFYHQTIKGKKPGLLEKSTWDTLKWSVKYLLERPLIDVNKYKYNIESFWHGKEKKIPVEKEEKNKVIENKANNLWQDQTKKEFIKKEVIQQKTEVNLTEEKQIKKLQTSEIYEKENIIAVEKELWYKGPMQKQVARLINTSLDRKEGAFVTLKEVKAWISVLNNYVGYNKTDNGEHQFSFMLGWKARTVKIQDESIVKRILELRAKEEKTWVKYKYTIDGFIDRRPFFMNNTIASNLMLSSYQFTVDKTGLLDTPLHFFKSVWNYDIDNAVFSENIKNSSIYNFNSDNDGKISSSTMREFMGNHKLDLLESFDFIYDFDTHDGNSDESYVECKKMRNVLNSKNIPFSLNFSGSKWFHIRIPGKRILESIPEIVKYIKENDRNIKDIYDWLTKFAQDNNITIDTGLYSWDLRWLIRSEWSIHPVTGCVVKPLTDKEFDNLSGKTLFEIQEIFKPSVLLNWSKELGIKRLNLQISDIIVREEIDGKFMSWEELRDSGKYDEDEWKAFRWEIQNPINKELKALSKNNPKEFNRIMESWKYQWYRVEAPGYIDLMTGRNFNYCRMWDNNSLRRFIEDLV